MPMSEEKPKSEDKPKRKPYSAPAIMQSAPFEELKLNCGFGPGGQCPHMAGTS